jgi:hypothetical protein
VTAKLVLYRDERNAEVASAVVALDGGWTTPDIPGLLARTDRWDAKPEDFRVLRVLDVTGDQAVDEAAILVAHAELIEKDAAILQRVLAEGVGPLAQSLQRDGIDPQWVQQHYDQVAAGMRQKAAGLTAKG